MTSRPCRPWAADLDLHRQRPLLQTMSLSSQDQNRRHLGMKPQRLRSCRNWLMQIERVHPVPGLSHFLQFQRELNEPLLPAQLSAAPAPNQNSEIPTSSPARLRWKFRWKLASSPASSEVAIRARSRA